MFSFKWYIATPWSGLVFLKTWPNIAIQYVVHSVLHSCLFEIICVRIFRRRLFVCKVNRWQMSCFVIRQHSEPYRRVARTVLWYNISFNLLDYTLDKPTDFSLKKAHMALSIRLLTQYIWWNSINAVRGFFKICKLHRQFAMPFCALLGDVTESEDVVSTVSSISELNNVYCRW